MLVIVAAETRVVFVRRLMVAAHVLLSVAHVVSIVLQSSAKEGRVELVKLEALGFAVLVIAIR